jgi:hypothetical protein
MKDDGADIIAWTAFEDGRAGKPILMIQCATGENYIGKAGELRGRYKEWCDYIDWAVDPLLGFAIPFVCVKSRQWRMLSNRGGVVLDRIRITSAVGNRTPATLLNGELTDWNNRLADALAGISLSLTA